MIFVRHLVWETENVAHIARHQVTPDEVAEVCSGDFLVGQGHSGRLKLIGKTKAGRWLVVVLAPKSQDNYYPVTAHDASRNDRRLYQQIKEEEVKV